MKFRKQGIQTRRLFKELAKVLVLGSKNLIRARGGFNHEEKDSRGYWIITTSKNPQDTSGNS